MFKITYGMITILLPFIASHSRHAFSSEPNRCLPGSHWVKQHHRKAYQRADGTFVSATTVSAHCGNNPVGYDVFSEKFKVGRPANWPLTQEQLSHWTDEERERILDALSYLPDDLRKASINGLYRMKKSINFPNPATGNSTGDVVFYDTAFDAHRNLSQILAHELAHRIYRSLNPEEAEDYRDATFWWNKSPSVSNPKWTCLRKGFVAPDGSQSPEEDFSNNIEYYLFNMPKLKKLTPQAFDWIKGHFGDKFKLGNGKS